MKLLVGDCLERLKELPDNSVDSVVTDPPYGLEFMGQNWDAPWKGDVRQRGDATFTQGDRRHGPVRHGMSAGYGGDSIKALQAFQQWCEQWAVECLRVLKPGGHMLAFGGTRTYHRMVCAIEDAGFEIRDSVHWTYGSGFPKSHNPFKDIKESLCPLHESAPHAALVSPWHPVASPEAKALTAVALARTLHGDEAVLLTRTGVEDDSSVVTATSWSELEAITPSNTDMSWRSIWAAICDPTSMSITSTTTAVTTAWKTWNSLIEQSTPGSTTPGRDNQTDGCECSAAHVASSLSAASLKSNVIRVPTAPASAIGLGADYLAGIGTAAKPSHEPIVVARKPLIGTVAKNVLEHGTGALNIDGCRVGFASADDESESKTKNQHADFGSPSGGNQVYGDYSMVESKNCNPPGRWPANTILTHSAACVQTDSARKVPTGTAHPTQSGREKFSSVYGKYQQQDRGAVTYGDSDGKETVPVWECTPDCPVAELDRQSGNLHGSGNKSDVGVGKDSDYSASAYHISYAGRSASAYHISYAGRASRDHKDSGGASRFFQQTQWSDEWDGPVFIYQAKASKKERNAGLDKNHHPTVKPVALMRYLVRLVTPPGGKVLDPFMGSGTTAVAATLEGFDWVGVELTDEYVDLIKGRVVHAYQEYRKSQEQQSFEIGDPA